MELTEMDVKKIVKEKYGQAAAQAKSGARSCCGPASFFLLFRRSDHKRPLHIRRNGPASGKSSPGFAWVRQSHGSGRAEPRRNRA